MDGLLNIRVFLAFNSSDPQSTDLQQCSSPPSKRTKLPSDSSSTHPSNDSSVSKTDNNLHDQAALKVESIQNHATHTAVGTSDHQVNHAGDGHTSPHGLKETRRCSEGEAKESKPPHPCKFGSGDGRRSGEERNRLTERPHCLSSVKDRDRYRHHRDYDERNRYGHTHREHRPNRERSTSRERYYRDRDGERHWDRYTHYHREHYHSQRRPREERDRSRERRHDAYRSSGHHNRDGVSSNGHGGRGKGEVHTVSENSPRARSPPSVSPPPPGHHKRKRSLSADTREGSEECRAKKAKKKKRNKDKHRLGFILLD